MAKTVTALYDRMEDARNAVADLLAHNFVHTDISVVVNDAAQLYAEYGDEPVAVETVKDGVGTGALLGGLTGLVAGIAALAIPGIGPAIAAGPLAAALVGGGLGALTGGLIGALVEAGMPEDEAGYYAEGVRRGGILVAVRALGDLEERAVAILSRYDPVDIEQRVASWREQGWDGFDIEADPRGAEAMKKTVEYYEGRVPEKEEDAYDTGG